jgi:hypothetical protein
MIEKVKELLSKDIEEIISSPLSLDLLQVYSQLYLCGKSPDSCAKSQRKYFEQLKINGMEKAKNIKRTCKPAWTGNMYISKEARHFNDVFITDEEAIAVLKRKHISEDMFLVLPEGYSADLMDDLKSKALKIGVEIKDGMKLKKLKELFESKATKLQNTRALEVIDLGVDPVPENLGLMSEDEYEDYKKNLPK